MLIPIDDDIDVPLQSIKTASSNIIKLNEIFNDLDKQEQMLTNIALSYFSEVTSEKELSNAMIQKSEIIARCGNPFLLNNYTYLSEDVCDMIFETQKSLKSWNINDLYIKPNTGGVIIFEKPQFQYKVPYFIQGKEPDQKFVGGHYEFANANVIGITWTLYPKPTTKEDSTNYQAHVLWASLITESNDKNITGMEYSIGHTEFAYKIADDGSLIPIWKHNETGPINKVIIDYFAATMMLMQQREIIAEPATHTPTIKRGKRRDPVLMPTGKDGEKTPFRISTVSLSETVRAAYAANSNGTGKKPTKSWWVKGHWRRQPYGPERSLRKLIYIHPHISGNVNAPLDDRKTITKVVP